MSEKEIPDWRPLMKEVVIEVRLLGKIMNDMALYANMDPNNRYEIKDGLTKLNENTTNLIRIINESIAGVE